MSVRPFGSRIGAWRAEASRTVSVCKRKLLLRNRIKYRGVILRRSDARRAKVAGIAPPKNPVNCKGILSASLFIRLLDKVGGHPEPAPRGRRRGGAQSKDPAECKTDARTPAVLSRNASTAFRPSLRPRRNSAQHDLDFESKTSHPSLPGKLSSNRISMSASFAVLLLTGSFTARRPTAFARADAPFRMTCFSI